uniref:DUF3480 domain-containing protein n=1 Tax=Heterorhabditis bacteriophora TaxID=37862 RepID=A0A1I7XBM0_HETBA
MEIIPTALIGFDDVACYSCVSLNYRLTVAARNAALPVPQNRQNLSGLFNAMELSGLGVPLLTDSCADVSLSVRSSFLLTPVTICRNRRWNHCAKVTFVYKGETKLYIYAVASQRLFLHVLTRPV